MKNLFRLLTVHFILSIAVCQAQTVNEANLAKAKIQIDSVNKAYFQAFAKGDSSILINCYTYDCWIMRPNSPTLCGVDAPLIFFKASSQTGHIKNGKFITVDLFGNGEEFITEEGFWQTLDAQDKPLDHGKYLVLWRKTPGGWKRFRDSFNSDMEK